MSADAHLKAPDTLKADFSSQHTHGDRAVSYSEET